MTLPPIYPILDTAALANRNLTPITAAEALLEAGASLLQYRHKAFWSRHTYAEAQQISRLCNEAKVSLVLNDRADYAALINTGLHLGQDDLAPEDARKLIGPNAILGFSTHNPAQMHAAQTEPVNYVAFGPIFPTASKAHPDPTTGPEALKQIRSLTTRPLVAIGGITLANARACFEAGADSLAIIAGLLPDPCTRTALRSRMKDWLQLSDIRQE